MKERNNVGGGELGEFKKLGEYLRHIREKKGASIEDVVAYTRIRKEYIEALESDSYELLPERTYALGYLRSYANFLELDNVDAILKYLDNTYIFSNPAYEGDKNYKGDKPSSEVKDKTERQIPDKVRLDRGVSAGKLSRKNTGQSIFFIGTLSLVLIIVTVWVGVMVTKPKDELGVSVDKEEELLSTINGVIDNKEFVIAPKEEKEVLPSIKSDSLVPLNNKNDGSSSLPNNYMGDVPKESSKPDGINEKTDVLPKGTNNAEDEFNEEPKKIIIVKFPRETLDRRVSLVFLEDVWIQIHKKSDNNTVYLDTIFKEGQSYNVPGVEDIAMSVGNYKGLYLLVDDRRVELSSNRKNSVVIHEIDLNGDALFSKYDITKR